MTVRRGAPSGVPEMPPLDAGTLLEVVSEDSPAGPNLEFDPDFGALERAAQGKPEQQYGGTIIPAEEPDWKEVESQAGALLERTRDLRVLAATGRRRDCIFPACRRIAEVVSMTRQLLETRWDEIHPQLDPEEDNDPTLRANALLRLAHPGDVLRCLRTLPLARSPRVGQYSWRDVGIATGTIESRRRGEADRGGDPRGVQGHRSGAARRVARRGDRGGGGGHRDRAVFDTRAGYGTGPDFEESGQAAEGHRRARSSATPWRRDRPRTWLRRRRRTTALRTRRTCSDAGAAPVARRAGARSASPA